MQSFPRKQETVKEIQSCPDLNSHTHSLSLSDENNNEWNLWILKKYISNFSNRWKFEPDIPNTFGNIFKTLQICMSSMILLITLKSPSTFVLQFTSKIDQPVYVLPVNSIKHQASLYVTALYLWNSQGSISRVHRFGEKSRVVKRHELCRGIRGHAPRKCLKWICSEMQSGALWAMLQWYFILVLITFWHFNVLLLYLLTWTEKLY